MQGTFFSLSKDVFHPEKKKKKKKENGEGRNKPIVSKPIPFPIRSILFCFQITKGSPRLAVVKSF